MSISVRVTALAAACIVGVGVLPAAALAQAATPLPTPADASPTPTEPPPTPAPGPYLGGDELATIGAPVVSPSQGLPPLPDVESTAWLVADADTGSVLAASNAYVQRPPASTIKLLTAVALLPLVPDDVTYVATDDDAWVLGSRVGLVPNESYSRGDLEHGLLLASGNDVAHALAEITGGQSEALDLMNAAAARLGAVHTRALTPHGLDEPGQVSTAYDLALIGRAVLDDGRLIALAGTRSYTFPGLDGETFQIQNHNRLLGSYDGAVGLKTGYTSQAGHTMVAAADRDGRRLIATVMNPTGRAEPVAAALLDWGFAVPADAEPVGVLVTPEEVAAIAETAVPTSNATVGGNDPPAGDADPTVRADPTVAPLSDTSATEDGPGSGTGVPPWLIAGVGAGALLAVVGGLIFTTRRGRGRYAA